MRLTMTMSTSTSTSTTVINYAYVSMCLMAAGDAGQGSAGEAGFDCKSFALTWATFDRRGRVRLHAAVPCPRRLAEGLRTSVCSAVPGLGN